MKKNNKKNTNTILMESKLTIFLLVVSSIVLFTTITSCSDMINEIGTIKLSYNSQGGSDIDPEYLERGTLFDTLPIPIYPGYTFDGWYSNAECTGEEVVKLTVLDEENITLYAKWDVNTNTVYKVEHYQQDVSGSGYIEYETDNKTGNTDTIATAVAKSYTGFSENTSYVSRLASGNIAGDGTLILKLYYDRDTFTVSYESNEGSSVSDTTGVRYNSNFSAPTSPTRTGYTFSGWYKEAGLTNGWNFSSDTVTEDITLYADWDVNTNTAYKVEHYQQDITGSGYTKYETDNKTGNTDTIATAVAKSYSGFSENTSHASRVASGNITGDGTLVLELYYDRDIFTVSYESNEGSSVSDTTGVRYEATISAPTSPTRAGYTFEGWYKTDSFNTLWNFSSDSVTEDTILYADWSAHTDTTYKVEHYQQDVSGFGYTKKDTDNETGTTDTLATAIAKSYTGFSENTSHASRIASGNITGDGTLILELYYDRNTFTVSYESNEGSSVSNTTGVRYEATISAPTSPTRDGYTFEGWYKTDSYTTTWTFSSDTVTEDTTLYADWSANTNTAYTVEHYQQNVADDDYSLEDTDNETGTTDTEATAVAKSYTGFSENTSYPSRLASGNIAGDGSLVLKLYYDRDTFTVSYESNEGSSVSDTTGVRYDATFSAPTSPTRTGYTFDGWYTEDELTTEWIFSTDTVTEATTLYAAWSINQYTVSFESNEGSSVSDITDVNYNTTISEPTSPTRDGYTFDGWYTEAELTTEWTFSSDTVTEDITLYAAWTANTDTAYKVEHYQQNVADDDYSLEDTDNETGTTDTEATAVAKSYTGFSENTSYPSRLASGNIAGDGSLVLKLYYDRDTFTVSYESNEGSSVSDTTGVRYDATFSAPTSPTRTGYTFDGWYTEDELTTEWIFSTDTVTEATTLYAAWSINQYTVSFESNEGSSVSDITDVNYNTTISEPTSPTRDGYTFDGWYTEAGLTTEWTFSTDTVTEDITLYAAWTANTDTAYKVEHYQQNVADDDYTLEDTDNETGTTDTEATAVAKSYTGFSENTSYPSRLASGNIEGDGSLVLKLYYDRDTFTVSYDSNEGSSVEDTEGIRYDATFSAPTSPTKANYILSGWYKESSLTNEWDFSTDTVTEDITLYALWVPNKSTVSFDSNDGSSVSDITDVVYNTSISAPTAPTKTGYSFSGWYKESSLTTQWDFPTDTVTEDITLYAKWTANSYTVSFDKRSGSGGTTSVSATYDTSMPAATAPTRTNYTFSGYYDEVDGGGTQYYSSTMTSAHDWNKSSNTTLYAYWVGVTSTVSFDKQSGSGGSYSVIATYNAAMPTATAPSRTGYTFNGYYTSTNGGGTQYYTSAMASARNWDKTVNTTLYAAWTPSTSTVTFDKQGGTGGSTSVTATYGSAMPTASAPTRAGYVFDGYYTSTNGGGTQYYTSTMASSRAWDQSSDDTLYAKWREYEVGDIGPAGGFIFYDKGYSSSGWRYLSAAPRGWYGGTTDPTAPWGGYGVTTGATSQSYGAGLENTNLIVATLGSGTYAAKLCADYSNTVNGVTYSDWFLPGGDALFKLAYYYHHSYYANMDSVYYWSSTETDSTHSYIMSASGSSVSLFAAERVPEQIRSVRPIRRF